MSDLIKNERWFAWHPIVTDDYRFVWLQYVRRSKYKVVVVDDETLEISTKFVWGYMI